MIEGVCGLPFVMAAAFGSSSTVLFARYGFMAWDQDDGCGAFPVVQTECNGATQDSIYYRLEVIECYGLSGTVGLCADDSQEEGRFE